MSNLLSNENKDFFDSLSDAEILNVIFTKHPRMGSNYIRYGLIEACIQGCAKELLTLLPDQMGRRRVIFKLQEVWLLAVAAVDREHAMNNILQKRQMKRELEECARSKAGLPPLNPDCEKGEDDGKV